MGLTDHKSPLEACGTIEGGKMNRGAIYIWGLMLLAVPFLQGSSCFSSAGVEAADRIGKSLDGVNQTMEDAVQKLDSQSTAWQGTLTNLETKLASDAKDLEKQIADDVNQLVDHIDTVAKDGAQFAQEGMNCEADIIASHVKIALQNLLIDFLNKWSYKDIRNRPYVDYQPTVCTVNPAAIEVASWKGVSGQLVLSGVDFNLLDTQKPLAYILHKSGPDTSIPANYIARQTNYRIGINVASLITDKLIPPGSLLLELRWAGRKVNPNEISIVAPPQLTVPPGVLLPPTPVTYLDTQLTIGGDLASHSENKIEGGPCTPGYHRVQCQVNRQGGDGLCQMAGWASTDTSYCDCVVHVEATATQLAWCRITITQSK